MSSSVESAAAADAVSASMINMPRSSITVGKSMSSAVDSGGGAGRGSGVGSRSRSADVVEEEDISSSSENLLNMKNVRATKAQIGVIDTSFPDLLEPPEFDGFDDFPRSYYTTSPKERLLLLFAENFRRQYSEVYQRRKPPILAVYNECQIQASHLLRFKI